VFGTDQLGLSGERDAGLQEILLQFVVFMLGTLGTSWRGFLRFHVAAESLSVCHVTHISGCC
jgi:hypothetical protein